MISDIIIVVSIAYGVFAGFGFFLATQALKDLLKLLNDNGIVPDLRENTIGLTSDFKTKYDALNL